MNKLINLLVLFGLCLIMASYSPELLSQSPCTDCVPCGEGTPCCSIYNACNYEQTYCFSDAGCASSGDVVNGCDMACTPIDSGVLFLLLGGAAFGGLMLMRNRRHELTLVQERS